MPSQIPGPSTQQLHQAASPQGRDPIWNGRGSSRPIESHIQTLGLQAIGIRHVCGNEPERKGIRRNGGGVWGGTPWNVHDRIDTGCPSSGLEEAISGSTVDGGVERIRELVLR